MKIRKGFVTNSSSISSVIITIRSKTLTDILKKYSFHSDFINEDTFHADTNIRKYGFTNLDASSLEAMVNDVIANFDSLLKQSSLKDFEIEELAKVQNEVRENGQAIIDDVAYISYNYKDDFYGLNLADSYKQAAIDKKYIRYHRVTIREKYTFEIIDGKAKENYDYKIKKNNYD